MKLFLIEQKNWDDIDDYQITRKGNGEYLKITHYFNENDSSFTKTQFGYFLK